MTLTSVLYFYIVPLCGESSVVLSACIMPFGLRFRLPLMPLGCGMCAS